MTKNKVNRALTAVVALQLMALGAVVLLLAVTLL